MIIIFMKNSPRLGRFVRIFILRLLQSKFSIYFHGSLLYRYRDLQNIILYYFITHPYLPLILKWGDWCGLYYMQAAHVQ